MCIYKHKWQANFYSISPLFSPLTSVASRLTDNHPTHWPGLNDYQILLDQYTNKTNPQLKFIPQDGKSKNFNDSYEARIYLNGEIQTRTHNWHDFFQVLIWCSFPKIKLLLNTLHYDAAKKRQLSSPYQSNRSPIENFLTLFDECGIIIASSDDNLLEDIRKHQWKNMFWTKRQELEKNLRCIIFGHALYEKSLLPYIGMTGNALLLKVNDSFHNQSLEQQLLYLDNSISDFIKNKKDSLNTSVLTPFPVLGMPGWDANNNNENYYDDQKYFRKKH